MSDQSTIFAELVVNLGALAGLTTAGVGVAHVVTTVEPWCNETALDHECVGPLLIWNTQDAFSHVRGYSELKQRFLFGVFVHV
jgi:hypothetical protein